MIREKPASAGQRALHQTATGGRFDHARLAIAAASAATALMKLLASAERADARVVVTVNKSRQRMSVAVNGAVQYTWPVSTGRAPYGTPNGTYSPQMMARSWFSRKDHNAPMPYSIFYYKGYAIHGLTHIYRLGGPASRGCVRLHPRNAATLFALVQGHGKANTRIVVTVGGIARRAVKRNGPRAEAPERPAAPAYIGLRASPFGALDGD